MKSTTANPLSVVIIKPSKYGPGSGGHVERFRWGFMPNAGLRHMDALTPSHVAGRPVRVTLVDEYVQTDLRYLGMLNGRDCDLLALAGTQSHQLHRALDLSALARHNGVRSVVIGGPHPMTCDTSEMHGRGISFALAEAELIWPTILDDATRGELQPVYGKDQRWQEELTAAPLRPPTKAEMRHYLMALMGIYPARGCPYVCNFCSVIKIAGQKVRSQAVFVVLETIRRAIQGGVRWLFFTSDNFNKWGNAKELLRGMIDENLRVPFMVQCDTQITKDPELVELLAQAGCVEIFFGVESFDRATLLAAQKPQNHPDHYAEIIRLCHSHSIRSYFSNIIGFPSQDEAAVLEHVRKLRSFGPSVAAFYILTPIPGTEQYDDFRREGLIHERNLDRFDTTSMVWDHPRMQRPGQLRELLFRCYREFFSFPDVARGLWRQIQRKSQAGYGVALDSALFHRWNIWRGQHPMSGGIGRIKRDCARDYAELRRKTFGFDLASLPDSLKLSAADVAFQRPR